MMQVSVHVLPQKTKNITKHIICHDSSNCPIELTTRALTGADVQCPTLHGQQLSKFEGATACCVFHIMSGNVVCAAMNTNLQVLWLGKEDTLVHLCTKL